MKKPRIVLVYTDYNWFADDAHRARRAFDENPEEFARRIEENPRRAYTGFCGLEGSIAEPQRAGQFERELQYVRPGPLRPFIELDFTAPRILYRRIEIGDIPLEVEQAYPLVRDAIRGEGEFAAMEWQMNGKNHIDLVVTYVNTGSRYLTVIEQLHHDFDVEETKITHAF
ncbi:hypothetical protein GF342_03210 [Candidatus Woesearchaeota archaeon]|nr:hypothetical protein [Candidatus Woesearchaeota archaeon]